MKNPLLAAVAAPLLGCLAGTAAAHAASDDALAVLQQQVRALGRQVAQQHAEIDALRARVVQLQMGQRGKGYPGDPLGAQLLRGEPVAGVPVQPATAPGAIVLAQAQAPSDAALPTLGTTHEAPAGEVRQSRTEVAAQGHAPLFHRRLTLTAGWSDSYYDRRELALSGFLALDAIFLGNISIAQTKAHIDTFDLAAQYGIGDDLTLNIDLPYVLRNSRFLSAGQNASSSAISQSTVSSDAIGDVNFGFDYRLVREHGRVHDVVASLKVTAPTGTSPFGIAVYQPDAQNTNLQVPQRLPTGNGVWSINPSVSFLTSSDPLVLFGSLGYLYNVTRSVGNIDPASINSPGRVKLGDGVQIGGGFALVLNDRASVSTSLTSLIARSTRVELPGQGWQTVAGSASTNVSLGFGVNYALSDHLTLSAMLQAGLTPDAPNYALSIRFPYRF